MFVEILVLVDKKVEIFKVLIHLFFDIIHFKLAKKRLPSGLKPAINNKLLMIFLRKLFKGELHFLNGAINIFTQLHILKSVDTGLFEMTKSLDFELRGKDIFKEDLFGLLGYRRIETDLVRFRERSTSFERRVVEEKFEFVFVLH